MNTTKYILNYIIKEKASGSTSQELNVQMKIMLKGINVKGILEDKISNDPVLNEKLREIANEFGVDLKKMGG